MRVLQLGKENWRKKYKIPKSLEWHFNDFPEPKVIIPGKGVKPVKGYNVVLITGPCALTADNWQKLQWLVSPYDVLYNPATYSQLDGKAKSFLRMQAAQEIKTDPQNLINHLPEIYYPGQSGIRIPPQNFLFNETNVKEFSFIDSDHVQLEVNSADHWTNLGSYQNSIYLDAGKSFDFWLEIQPANVKIRLRFYTHTAAGDGNPAEDHVLKLGPSSSREWHLPLPVSDNNRYVSVSLEAKGKGQICLGVLHYRWSREGQGVFFPGGRRIVNLQKREDIAYFFNPGDLKPPLNVYFSGARSLEGFEAFPLFRYLHAPSLLFTDMRLEIGQFYDDFDQFMGEQIKKIILEKLATLHFGPQQLIMNGISMGTYGALKYGAELGAYMINVAKPLGDLGYIATRFPLQRPDEFDTILNIDQQINHNLSPKGLHELDERFWQDFNRQDLSRTRLFVGYMKNDDYDNRAIGLLQKSPAVKKSVQFSYKGFMGRHNDNPSVTRWFIARLRQVLEKDFNRKL